MTKRKFIVANDTHLNSTIVFVSIVKGVAEELSHKLPFNVQLKYSL
jgi:hypothetical protein